MFYLFGSLFGIGFGGEMTAYLVVNRQYFGMGPTSILYGWEMMGALLGHAVASGLAGLVLLPSRRRSGTPRASSRACTWVLTAG